MYNLIVTLENESNLHNVLHKTCSKLILLPIHCHPAILGDKNIFFFPVVCAQTVSFFENFPAVQLLLFCHFPVPKPFSCLQSVCRRIFCSESFSFENVGSFIFLAVNILLSILSNLRQNEAAMDRLRNLECLKISQNNSRSAKYLEERNSFS